MGMERLSGRAGASFLGRVRCRMPFFILGVNVRLGHLLADVKLRLHWPL